MVHQIGIPNQGEDGALNSSVMNISILDQSYCVTSKNSQSQKIAKTKQIQQDQRKLMGAWKNYIREHRSEDYFDE